MKHCPRITRSTKLQVGKNGKSEADSFDLLVWDTEVSKLKYTAMKPKVLETPRGRA